ncbi:hypothetical protein PCL_10387 [Purpureocillium lilacinum]|uniref:Amine oxidase domain-containing protein n=1 Tax=Purpureocillium lilacinum TaxID=33203 RepID=A0A2U3EFY3_PURLI|nr:hypothetical protein Purlil1_3724 [Purpureocillium lilacinum]PWI73372.1 hypothetical protein PCL_10387 [Purpureocillium lilacinum]
MRQCSPAEVHGARPRPPSSLSRHPQHDAVEPGFDGVTETGLNGAGFCRAVTDIAASLFRGPALASDNRNVRAFSSPCAVAAIDSLVPRARVREIRFGQAIQSVAWQPGSSVLAARAVLVALPSGAPTQLLASQRHPGAKSRQRHADCGPIAFRPGACQWIAHLSRIGNKGSNKAKGDRIFTVQQTARKGGRIVIALACVPPCHAPMQKELSVPP